MPEISVVMPVYNTKEAFFRCAIDSILQQTYTDFELLIIDDCSEAYIGEIVAGYHDDRIKYFRFEKNAGAAVARNCGLDQARGKYIAFLDADDIALPDRLAVQHEFLEQHPEIGCLGTVFDILKGRRIKKSRGKSPLKHDEIVDFLLFEGCLLCQSSVMIRKSVLNQHHVRYNPDYIVAQDYVFWLDLIGKTRFEILNTALVVYRFHEGNISHKKQKLQRINAAKAQIEAVEKHLNVKLPPEILNFCAQEDFDVKAFADLEKIVLSAGKEDVVPRKIVDVFLKRKYKKLYRHTRSLQHQWYLLTCPLSRFFGFPVRWRLFYFITRGIF